MDAEKSCTTWYRRIGFKLFLVLGMVWVGAWVAANAAQDVTLAWDANEAQSDIVSGYRLYYGTASRQYAASNRVDAPQTTSTVSNLSEGSTYYFAVTAVTSGGLESDYSVEISYTIPTTGAAPALSFTEVEFANPASPTSPTLVQADEVFVDLGGSSWNPATGRPRLEIRPLGQPIVAYSVEFQAPPGKACELQVSTDLEVWRRVFYRGSQPLAERMEFFDFPGEAKTRRYYRVAVW